MTAIDASMARTGCTQFLYINVLRGAMAVLCAIAMAAHRLIIAGGGLAGSLTALALAKRPDVQVTLVEEQPRIGGDHIWSFFDKDMEASERDFLAPLLVHRWPDHTVRFPRRQRTLPVGYNSLTSGRLDRVVRDTLGPDRLRLGAQVASVESTRIVLAGGEALHADAVIDARGAGDFTGLRLGWQKFVGLTCRFTRPHGLTRPIVMDATVEQADGYRFVYCLPFSPTEMLIEDTYYSDFPALDVETLRGRIHDYAAKQGWELAEVTAQEQGVLPIVLDGAIESLWRDSPAPLLGLRGGFFQPTTGYSLPGAVRNALLLANAADLSAPSLFKLLHGAAKRQWQRQGFYRMINRLLFDAAAPERRYAVLEHFYRLDPGLIGRFYAGNLRLLDKLRILSGRPPVSVARAAAAAWGRKGRS